MADLYSMLCLRVLPWVESGLFTVAFVSRNPAREVARRMTNIAQLQSKQFMFYSIFDLYGRGVRSLLL